MTLLKTDYKNDILDLAVNTDRKFQQVDNGDGTYSYNDATAYSQVGDTYGANEINETNRVINNLHNIVLKTVNATISRWLRFDPNNKKGLIIKAGTYIRLSNGEYADYATDTTVDLSSDITAEGTDYFVFISDTKEIHAYTAKQSTGVYIGRFHTLCANVGNINMIAPASPSSGLVVGGNYLIKSYDQTEDPDFYDLYNKSITAVSANATSYDVITTAHPLSGFSAGDILPESVFCLTFHPECLVEDAMVFDKDTGICVDVYLQSGTGLNTRSAYNAVHTASRTAGNHAEDMRMVGKTLLRDFEFTSASIGSNQATNIQGSADATRVGGHSDTAGRRMISAIGCEEMCGYLWQWLDEISPSGGSAWANTDGRGSFGQEYGTPYVLLAGGSWTTAAHCGSRCRISLNVGSTVNAGLGGRGSSRVLRR